MLSLRVTCFLLLSTPKQCCCLVYVHRLKSLGEGCKVWSSSAPNLGKSPKHAPMTAGFSSLNEMGESPLFFPRRLSIKKKKSKTSCENCPQPTSLLSLAEECCDLEESPGSLLPSETSSNGATEDSGSLWGNLGPNTVSVGGGSCQGPASLGSAVSYQDSVRRCGQRKKSDVLLLGCASLLASVALGQDLLQLGKLQVRGGHLWTVTRMFWLL